MMPHVFEVCGVNIVVASYSEFCFHPAAVLAQLAGEAEVALYLYMPTLKHGYHLA